MLMVAFHRVFGAKGADIPNKLVWGFQPDMEEVQRFYFISLFVLKYLLCLLVFF